MKKVLSLVLLLVFAFQAFLFPSACPSAQAEVTLPYYNPVELRNPDVAPIDLKAKTPYKPHAEGWLPERSGYLDGTISVRIDSRIINNTIVWFTWVQVADPTQIRTTSWRKYPSKKEVFVTAMAEREHSVLAINGDFCVDRSQGVVIRNGETLRRAKSEDWDCMFIDGNGDFHIRRTPVPDNFDDFDGEIMHSFVFGPGLVIDGILQTEFGELTMRLIGGNKKAQRTVFCQMDTLSYLIDILKGRNPASVMLCTLLDKPDRRVVDDVVVDFTCFEIPDEFVVGFGLDYDQRYRNLPYIGVVRFDDEE